MKNKVYNTICKTAVIVGFTAFIILLCFLNTWFGCL